VSRPAFTSDYAAGGPSESAPETIDSPAHTVGAVQSGTPEWIRRAENLVALAASAILVVRQWRQINWATFVILFSYIDLIGYLPGLARVHHKKSLVIEKPFYWAYNSTHTFLTAAPVAALLVLRDRQRRPWSALAICVHLFGDRALFGAFSKPVGSAFEHIENYA
jgi:hypothetical protein